MMIHFVSELWCEEWEEVDEVEVESPSPAAESLLTTWSIFSVCGVAIAVLFDSDNDNLLRCRWLEKWWNAFKVGFVASAGFWRRNLLLK